MTTNDKKTRILNVIIDSLNKQEDLTLLTVRQIAKMADVNIALINYYFGSKDLLIQEAVSTVMESYTTSLFQNQQGVSSKQRIIDFVINIGDFSFQNYYLSKFAIQHDMLSGSTSTSSILMIPLREYYKNSKNDLELKLLSLQIIVPIQSIFLHADKISGFLYVDIFNKKSRDQIVKQIIDNVLA